MIHAKPGGHVQEMRQRFVDSGIDESRVSFVGTLSPEKYMDQYRMVDLCLDPFPYGGGTTTCDALWMGVPTVTLCGSTVVGAEGKPDE